MSWLELCKQPCLFHDRCVSWALSLAARERFREREKGTRMKKLDKERWNQRESKTERGKKTILREWKFEMTIQERKKDTEGTNRKLSGKTRKNKRKNESERERERGRRRRETRRVHFKSPLYAKKSDEKIQRTSDKKIILVTFITKPSRNLNFERKVLKYLNENPENRFFDSSSN